MFCFLHVAVARGCFPYETTATDHRSLSPSHLRNFFRFSSSLVFFNHREVSIGNARQWQCLCRVQVDQTYSHSYARPASRHFEQKLMFARHLYTRCIVTAITHPPLSHYSRLTKLPENSMCYVAQNCAKGKQLRK